VLGDDLNDDRLDGRADLSRRNEDLAQQKQDRNTQGDQGEDAVKGQRGRRVDVAVPHKGQHGISQDDRGDNPAVPESRQAACRPGNHAIFSRSGNVARRGDSL